MNNDMTNNNSTNIEDAVQYLTFKLDGEAYATEITKVREVLEHTDVTRVPRTPDYMKGVINLRGSVVPVVDLRMQFGLEIGEVTVDTCIIIVEVNINGQSTVLGALADSVQEVIDLRPDQLEPAPTLGTRVNNKFIQAMGKASDGSFIIMLNMDKVFSAEQINEVDQVSAEQGDSAETEAA
jgi:purine-binding chemotaxis protein CheW